MRVNIYAEELTDGVTVLEKKGFTGIRFFTQLPVLQKTQTGTLVHKESSGDVSSAITIWAETPELLVQLLQKAIDELENA